MMTPQELVEKVESVERAARIARGLAPDHVLTWADYPFAYAPDAFQEFRRIVTGIPGQHFLQVCAHLAFQDYGAANAVMETWQAAEPGDPSTSMRFGGAPPIPQQPPLPPVAGDYPADSAYFLCCSGDYFRRFGIVLLRSIADHAPGLRVHLHLMNPDLSLMRFVEPLGLALSLTHEACPQNRAYYHATRLIRFAEALERCRGSLLMTDTDALATGNIAGQLAGPLAMRVRPGRLSPLHQFSACFLRGDATSRPYFRRVSEILKGLPHWWGVDQFALFSAWIALRPQIELIGPEIASVVDDTPGLFWFTAGGKKESLLGAATPYARLFQDYIRR